MAKYGARNGKWAQFTESQADEAADKLPKYQSAKSVGQLNKVTDSLNFNEGSLPGDDTIALYQKSFKDGTVDVESVYLPVEDAAAMLGAKYDSQKGVSFTADDNPPYIGYGFVTHHVSKTDSYWQSVFYPKLKAAPSSESYETRGDNINFITDKLTFHLESPLCRIYKIVKDFDTEEAANTFIDGLFAGTVTAPGLQASDAS